jgi:nitrite reductase/ring-hydroxylating ferredoxin subunit/uncharacterized membrane protein
MASTTTNQQEKSWADTPPFSPTIRRVSEQLLNAMPWLDKLADPLQQGLGKLFGQPGEPSYKVKDILNGVWLGTVVHPIAVQIPIGAWTASFILDIAWLADQDNDGLAEGSDILMWTGNLSALTAAATGIANWADIYGLERRKGMFHALLNSTVSVMNFASSIFRLTGQRRTGITVASLAYLIAMYSAHLGGELSYANAIGVNHVADEGGSDDFVAVMNESELAQGKLTRVDVAGIPAVLVRDGKAIYAIAATCSHLGAPLDEGTFQNGVVYCPWHNSGFRMCDGSVANSPAVYAQPAFAVRVRNGNIELRRQDRA